jgi:hypothetical protein
MVIPPGVSTGFRLLRHLYAFLLERAQVEIAAANGTEK